MFYIQYKIKMLSKLRVQRCLSLSKAKFGASTSSATEKFRVQSSTVPEPVEGKARRFDKLSDQKFKVQSSTVPEPVEGKARRFDKLSDRRVQTNKSAAMPSAKSIPSSVRMKLLSFTNIIPESKYFLMFFKKL